MASRPRLICASAELAEAGKGVRFEVERHGLRLPAFAIRYDGRVHGYLNQCGHVPAELDYDAGDFFDYSKLYLEAVSNNPMERVARPNGWMQGASRGPWSFHGQVAQRRRRRLGGQPSGTRAIFSHAFVARDLFGMTKRPRSLRGLRKNGLRRAHGII